MADPWARLGLDLHLTLDSLGSLDTLGTGSGKRAGLERALREAVRRGSLPPGTPLPSSRALARDLGVARGTVTQVYEQLVAEGYLTSRPRSGVRVAPRPADPPAASSSVPPATLPPVSGADLRPGLPDLSSFPRREWLAATRHVLQTAPNTALGYGEPTGSAELREALAGYLGRARGVVTRADRIIICAGYTHALRLLCQTFVRLGAADRSGGSPAMAFEDPSPPYYTGLARHAGLRVSYVPVDGEGLVVDGLGAAAAAAVVTPAHQYPLGVTLSPGRRAELLDWARRAGAFVVEDDYDGEFRYDRQPVGALQQLAPERVVYVGTASKTMAPGLRIAWMALPADLVAPVLETMWLDEAYTNVIDQLALARLIDSGDLDRHLRRRRVRYRRRRDMLGAAVARHVPRGRLSGIAAGLHAVLEFPGDPAPEAELLERLTGQGVAVEGMSWYYGEATGRPPGIVIGYASPPEHAYAAALDALIAALIAALAGPR